MAGASATGKFASSPITTHATALARHTAVKTDAVETPPLLAAAMFISGG